ncbi:MAG: hypothetical protein LBG92_04830 [Prevotellaceae bacterium]|nr:hypothetical protein [Prevotellaceae bacterium]
MYRGALQFRWRNHTMSVGNSHQFKPKLWHVKSAEYWLMNKYGEKLS